MKPPIAWPALALATCTALLLAGCGGGDSQRARGDLIAARTLEEHAPADIAQLAADAGLPQQLGSATCGVRVNHIVYATRDPLGQEATASAAVMVPTGTAPACTGSRPVLLYAHGTTPMKSYNMAAPRQAPEALMVKATFAAHGYIVVAPNYLGYDQSSLPYHPYLNGEAQAVDMVDGLRAGLAHVVGTSGTQASRQLFVAGYSQGGHVAMYTQKVLERDHADEFTVTAAVPMSGPYDTVGFSDRVVSPSGQINIGATLFLPLLVTSYQNSYGNVYAVPSEVYQAPFDGSAPNLLPTDTPVATLVANGLLPNDPSFRLLFGPGGLLTDAFRDSYLASNFRADLQRNSLLGWTPRAPTALCAGEQDPTVYYFNSTVVQADFASRGATVPLWNLEARGSLPSGAGADAVYLGFQAAKLAAGSGAPLRYHGELVPPFCYALARAFFAERIQP
jgi:hypothetical protein